MRYEIPKKLLSTKYRRDMWNNVREVVKCVERVLPIKSAYVLGSFTTKKSRPADVDFILLLQTGGEDDKAKWSADMVIAPDNAYGRFVLKDADQWVKEKYGLKKSTTIKLK